MEKKERIETKNQEVVEKSNFNQKGNNENGFIVQIIEGYKIVLYLLSLYREFYTREFQLF